MTRQRQLILDIINASYDHPTAQEIFRQARERLPSIALGTVYRNLGLLVESGEARCVTLAGQPERYDRGHDPHDHMVCAECGRLLDARLPDLREGLEGETGLTVLSYELQVRCICKECEKKRRPRRNERKPVSH